MAKPVTTIEIAFNVGVTGVPTWTNVTSRVRHSPGIAIDHWRSDEGADPNPSTLALTLDNSDGRYTPGNTTSLHYPNVKRNRPIRVRSTVGGVTYERFNGYIDDWSVEWPAKVAAIADCSITATSRSARLGSGVELRSIIEEECLVDDPIAYYTMGEPAESTQANDSSGNGAAPLVVMGAGTSVVFGTATGPGTDGLTAVQFGGTLPCKFLGRDLGTTLTSLTIIFAFSEPVTPPSSYEVAVALDNRDGVTNNPMMFYVSTDGKMRADASGTAVTSANVVSGGSVHVAAVTITGSSFEFYIDGVSQGTAACAASFASTLGLFVGSDEPSFNHIWNGAISHVALYDTALSAARVLAISTAMLTGFAGETAAQRIARFAGYAGIASADTDLTGATPIAHFDPTGKTVLDAMRIVATTEGGVLFDGLDGKLVLRSRSHRYGATSAFTISYSGLDVAGALSPILDDQFQVNDMTATNADGVTGRAFDQASIIANGPYRESVDLATSNPDEPLSRSAWMVGRYAEASERISAVEVLLNSASSALTAGVLSSQVGTKLTLSGLPANAPASSMPLFVEGRSERINMDEDRVTLRTSPGDLFDDIWVLAVAGHSELGTTTRLAY